MKKGNTRRWVRIGVLSVVILAVFVLSIQFLPGRKGTEEEDIQLPYVVEEAGVEVRECFASTIPNPDAGDEMGEEIPSLEIMNRSGKYIRHVFLEIKTSDDLMYEVIVNDLPEEGLVWAFSQENVVWDTEDPIVSVKCREVEFGQQDKKLLDTIQAEEEDLTVTLTNTGTQDLTNLEVVCRCNFGEQYFGGISYKYPVASLPAGETVTIDAVECYMGTAEVVDIRPAG